MKRLCLALTIFLAQCSSNDDPAVIAPDITTADAVDVTLTSASVPVTITSAAGDNITARGLCWSANPNPELNNQTSKTENGTGAGSFTAAMTNLTLKKYYARAYANVGDLVFYGNEITVDIEALVPAITTTKLSTSADATSLVIRTAITYTHSLPITEQGILWKSGAGSLTISNGTKIIDGGSSLTFDQGMGSLSAWTTYSIRGYAITDLGIFYSSVLAIVTIPPVAFGSVSDFDGNTYRTVVVGNKTWMADNLKVTHYNDGAAMMGATSQDQFKAASSGAYVGYNASSNNAATYGYLYNEYAVNTNMVCMTGWHVPSAAEWMALAENLGGTDAAGGRMKSSTTWNNPNVAADNESGFNGLAGGSYCRVCLSNNGIFADQGTDGYWWSSTTGTFYYLTNDMSTLRTKNTAHVNDGLSIRCVKD